MSYPACGLFCVKMMGKFIENAVDGQPLAFMMETIQASGGMIDFQNPITGRFGRCAINTKCFLFLTRSRPDLVDVERCSHLISMRRSLISCVFGKALGGGFPIPGHLSREGLKGFKPADHSFTFAHFPVSMVAALATLRVLEEEGLLQHAHTVGEYFTNRLLEMKDKYELIGDVRGPGLMLGIELVHNKRTKEPAHKEAYAFEEEGIKRGVLFGHSKYAGIGNVVKIKPPLVISDAQAQESWKSSKRSFKNLN